MATMAMTGGWRNGFQHSRQTVRRETRAFGAAAHVDRGPKRAADERGILYGREVPQKRPYLSLAVLVLAGRDRVREKGPPAWRDWVATRSGGTGVPMAPMCVTEQTGYSDCPKFGRPKGHAGRSLLTNGSAFGTIGGCWRNPRRRSEQAQVMRTVWCAGSTGRCSPPRSGRPQRLGLGRAYHRSGCTRRR
jgi:hypothetical protein